MSTRLVCPTHGRAERLRTPEITDQLIMCVSESQLPLYKEWWPDLEYVVHPDDIVGLAPKRNWIIEKFKGDDVFMVDDDILSWRHLTSVPGLLEYIPREQVIDVVTRTFQMAADIGAYLIGYANVADTRTFSPVDPLRFKGFVAGHAFGLRSGHKLWWHPDVIQEDWWLSALNAHFHRICVVDSRYGAYQKDTFKGVGGQAAHRTRSREKQGFEILRKHFGSVIQHKAGTKTHGVQHPHQPMLALPY